MVLCGLVQQEEAFLLIGSEAPFDDCILIGRALVDVEVIQPQFSTLGMEPALKLQPVVSLDVAQVEREVLCGVIQCQQGPSLVQLGQYHSYLVAGIYVHSRIQIAGVRQPG